MTNIKQVYNERHKFKKAKRGDLTEVQFLISKLEENEYVYYLREKKGKSNCSRHILDSSNIGKVV